MYCKNCGKEIDEKAFVCPHCGVKTNIISQDDGPIGGLGILCFLFPIVGLILYLVWKETKPKKSSGAGKAALWGFIIGIVICLIYFIIGVSAGISMFNAQSKAYEFEATTEECIRNMKIIYIAIERYMDDKEINFEGTARDLMSAGYLKKTYECPVNGVGDKYYMSGNYETGEIIVKCPHEEKFPDHRLPESLIELFR